MTVKTFNISFPKELADQIDRKAKQQFGSRSDFLRQAAIKYLQDEKIYEGLMEYGKKIGQEIGYQSEETVAAAITKQRRRYRRWRPAG